MAIFENVYHSTIYKAAICCIELSQRFILKTVLPNIQSFTEGQSTLSLRLENFNANDSDGKENYAQMDDIAAIASAVSANKS